jgi:3-hydroxyisobutyrate dehydrogenase-like beta-hydroxyacid dehydrogenase
VQRPATRGALLLRGPTTSEPVLKVFGGNVKYLGEQVGAASALDMAILSYLYGAGLGFFHGARVAESEGFRADHYGSIVAEVSPIFGEFFKHEGAVIQSGNFEISESPLNIPVEATQRLAQSAREAGINSDFPAFVSEFFKKAAAAGYGNEEVAALIKVLREGA